MPLKRQDARTGVLAVCLAGFLVNGCSSVPSWADPAEWYRDTKKQTSTHIPGKDKNFPKLSSVPARPTAPSEAERKKMVKGLLADRQAARYSDEKIRRQSENVTAVGKSAN